MNDIHIHCGDENMAKKDIIDNMPTRAFMMANEAIVRGALEADAKLASFYPGSPTSEILDNFNSLQEHFDYKFTIAANEKVALEPIAGASMAGFRSFSSMKSV
ncbi:MAG: hypothetical protein AMK69_19910, partial [Nitrospira bacterium SG8_3]